MLIVAPRLDTDSRTFDQFREMLDAVSDAQSQRFHVFISYSHSDTDFVDSLTARFETDGITYWRDNKNLMVGHIIDKEISHGIQSNPLFLLVLSTQSLGSPWVAREVDEAFHEAARW